MIDKRVLDVVWETARETGTPDFVVEAVIARMLPGIRLVPQWPKERGEGRIGGCRIGGAPDLPAGVEWPRLSTTGRSDLVEADGDAPLPFLVQIDLAEVVPLDVTGELPREGMLYFFFRQDDDWNENRGHVIHQPGPPSQLRRSRVPVDMPAEERFKGLVLAPVLEWCLPFGADTGLDTAVQLEHEAFWDVADRVAEVQGLSSPWGPEVSHRLLGHPILLQADGLGNERLLLEVCSDSPRQEGAPETGMRWGKGCGRVYFVISRDDLKAHAFAEKPQTFMETQ